MLHVTPLFLLAFLPCSLNSDVEAATSRLRVELPPVSAYPPDGKIPAEVKDRLVFLDEDLGDLVVSFPPDLDSENPELGQEAQETRVTERVELAISTCPSLSVVIQEVDNGQSRGYDYRYRLRNRGAGRQPITKWVIPLSGQEPIGSMVSPLGWGVEESDIKPAVLEASAAWGDTYREKLQRSMLRRRIRWWSQHSQWRLEPGNAQKPFGFTTEARPGIVRAYIQGPYGISTQSSMPLPVDDQLWAFGFVENNSLSISTIGPKFSPDADQASIASDFLDSIRELIEHGELSGESKFIQEALGRLETLAEGDINVGELAPWSAEPGTDFEIEIRSAIRLSLRDRMVLDGR